MKIPKLFKKAAAFVMAAVTALSIMPATAFAAGDIGTIFFSHTYDSNGNAMRYNSSANIGGYTAGGTGNYKYRMFVDGENAFCIQPGVPLKTGNTLKKASSDTWNALSANQKKAVGLALLYGYQGNRNNLSGSDDEKWLATQTLVWEFVTGCREATGSYNQTSTTVYSLHFGSNYANSGARAVYDQIVAMLREHNTIPSFMSGGKNDITKELAYKDGKYSITLTDSNGVLSDYSFSSSDSNVSVSKSGNKLTISSTVAISGSVRITAKRNNVPTVSSSAKLIAYGDPNLQDLVTGVENADTVSAYINIETPTGTIALKKTSEDGVVEGISFTIKGDNFNKTVKTGKDGSVSVEGLFPGTYTVTEQSIDRYEPQKTQTVTLIGGKTSTVTFSNTLKRGSLEIVKTSEDNLVEGMKFHLYGTSLSGLPVDEYAVTDKNGLAKLPELMKNYKDGETEILTGLEEKLQVVFQKAQQMQKADRKGKICTMGISYLQSSVLTENYELRIDLYDKEFYLDSAECCTYWKPEFITGYLLQDVEYFKKEIRFKIPQIKTYELQQFIDGYLLNYMYLLAQFFQQILPQVLDKTKTLFQEVAEENMSVTFGEYMGKGIVVVGEREE